MSKKWEPDADPHQARRIGKTLEELGELTAVLARISIQGIDAIDPSTGKTNRVRMEEETADVLAQLTCNTETFRMDEARLAERAMMKLDRMAAWEAHFSPELQDNLDLETSEADARPYTS